MSIESQVFGAFATLVNDRCYPDAFPQVAGVVPVPAIRYSILGGQIDTDICGPGDEPTDSITIQVDVIAATASARATLRNLVRAAAIGATPQLILRSPPTQGYDEETRVYRDTLEFTIYGSSA